MNTLKIGQSLWNSGAAAYLSRACDESYTVDALGRDVKAGECRLFDIHDGQGAHVGSFVVRLDAYDNTRELVVVAAGGYLPGASLYRIVTPYVEALAAILDAQFLRGHTKRRGVGRLMEKAGWEQSEIIYRKEVSHGRKIIQ